MSKLISRRCWMSLTTAGLLSSLARPAVSGQSLFAAESFDNSLDAAFRFLNAMSDAYAAGSVVRLTQSYSDQGFAGFPQVAFTYDNAVLIQAYLARGRSEDLQRASILGRGLVRAQATNFPVSDGRLAQAYYVNVPDATGAYITPAAFPFYFYGSTVGDQSWAGMALAQLYRRTGTADFLNAALKIGNWIASNAYDTRGPGGFTFGAVINSSNQSVPSTNGKATEHNIDAHAFFTMIAILTNGGHATSGASWSSLAQHALSFVEAMFNTTSGFFYTGTSSDQVTISTGIIPEDVQTWSYLALLNKNFGVSLDWVKTNLVTIDTPSAPFSALRGLGNVRVLGETFDTASLATTGNDPEAVWLEGTAHTAAALLTRRMSSEDDLPLYSGDVKTAMQLLANIRLAQSTLGVGQKVNGTPLAPGQGIVAATGRLDTGFGYDYFPNLHIGATAWYALALLHANPFQLGLTKSGLEFDEVWVDYD